MIEVQKDLANAILERQEAIDDRARLFEMTDLLKTKYTTLMAEKLEQSKRLKEADADKEALAKTILEEKRKSAEAAEQAEKEKFELATELTNAKNEIIDISTLLLEQKERGDKLQERLDECVGEVNVLKEAHNKDTELIAKRDEQLQSERDRVIELGMECGIS